MIVSTILLSLNNVYVDEDGNLPVRPSFDKTLLTGLCKNKIVSDTGYNMLPPSIREVTVKQSLTDAWEPEIGITISEIDALSDLLIVVRSHEMIYGKQFRFDNFEPLAITKEIEIWRRK
jgi:hypothetical protein